MVTNSTPVERDKTVQSMLRNKHFMQAVQHIKNWITVDEYIKSKESV